MNKKISINDLAVLVAQAYGHEWVCLDNWDAKGEVASAKPVNDGLAHFLMTLCSAVTPRRDYSESVRAALGLIREAQEDLERTQNSLISTLANVWHAEYLEWLLERSYTHTEGRLETWAESYVPEDLRVLAEYSLKARFAHDGSPKVYKLADHEQNLQQLKDSLTIDPAVLPEGVESNPFWPAVKNASEINQTAAPVRDGTCPPVGGDQPVNGQPRSPAPGPDSKPN
jgi:hypothetical protein